MLTSVQMSDTRWRRGISRAKGPMLAPVQHILARRADFSPLSDRSLRYALHNDPPLRHAAKPDSVCANDPASYHALTDLLTRAWPKEKLGGRGLCARGGPLSSPMASASPCSAATNPATCRCLAQNPAP